MLNIPEEFFKEEVREGFTVPELMKRTWAAEMKVLTMLSDFFDKYDITYYGEYGTLLGAVRHKGFIPWDDDMDISLKRSDYMKLIAHADELPAPLRILSIYSSDTYYTHRAVCSNSREEKLTWNEDRIRDFYGCPFIINLDINPLDYIPRDPEFRKVQMLLYNIGYALSYKVVDYYKLTGMDGFYETPDTTSQTGETQSTETQSIETQSNISSPSADSREQIAALEEEIAQGLYQLKTYGDRFFGQVLRFDESRPLLNGICRYLDDIARLCPPQDSDMLEYYPHMVYSKVQEWRKKEWYDSTILLPFEMTEFQFAGGYEKQVLKCYGKNYMTPKKFTAVHDYPFYKKQEEYFKFLGKM